MSEAPERIWIETRHIPTHLELDDWATKPADREMQHFTGYTRTDTIPDPAAIWQEAMKAAERAAVIPCYDTRHVTLGDQVANAIRNIPNPYEAKP